MNHACTNCGHPATTHQPVCDAELDTIFGPEDCGCGVYAKETDD